MSESENVIALRLEKCAKEVESNLINALLQSNIKKLCYAYKTRVKPEDKLLEKVTRKRAEKSNYNLRSITDNVGLRLVSLFRRDMPILVEEIISLINHHDEVQPNPFVKEKIREIIIYSVNNYDEVTEKIVNSLKEKNIEVIVKKPTTKLQSYSSIHIVAELTHKHKSTAETSKYCMGSIPVEIQIRTVFEDAWGEIDHKFGYVNRQEKEVGYVIHNPHIVQEHLSILKKFTDACAEYADRIYYEALPSAATAVVDGKVFSVNSDTEVVERLKQFGESRVYIEKFYSFIRLRDEAIKEIDVNKKNGKEKLASAAEEFHKLADELPLQNEKNQVWLYLLYFNIKMNEAFCVLSINEKEYIARALAIYTALLADYASFPILGMRLAQTHGKLGDIENSLVLYKAVLSQINEFKAKKSAIWPDELPEQDYNYMQQVIPKLLGFQLWSKSEKLRLDDVIDTKQERVQLLLEAFEVTLPLLQVLTERDLLASAHNNILYYAVACLQIDFDSEHLDKERLKSQISKSLAFLEAYKENGAKFDLEQLDTLLHAYDYNGNKVKVIAVAKEIEQSGLDCSDEAYDNEDAADTLVLVRFARAMLRKYNQS